MLNRLATASLASLLALSAYACGDDDGDDSSLTPDSGPGTPDSGGSEADAGGGACDPSVSEDCNVTVLDAEGGYLLFEYINLDDQLAAAFGSPTVTRQMAHFVSQLDPNANPLPLGGKCVNLIDNAGWPLGSDKQPATYVDVGELRVIGQDVNKKDVEMVIPRGAPGAPASYPADNWTRIHDVFYERIVPDLVLPDSLFTVEMGGAGSDVAAASWANVAYMPGHFEIMEPGLNDDYTLSATKDNIIRWEVVEHPNVPDPSVLVGGALVTGVALGMSTGMPILFCVGPASAGERNITAADVQDFRETVEELGGDPNLAIMLRNYIAHTIAWLPNGEGGAEYDTANPRRVDFINVYCHAQLVNTSAE
jgi:hypothetical protein